MKELGNFKNTADEIMNDIKVSKELEEKTLARCRKKSNTAAAKILVPAACIAVIIAAVNISGWLPRHTSTAEQGIPEINILMGTTGDDQTKTAESAPNTLDVPTLEEAGRIFGSTFLTPAFIPGKFRLTSIRASGPAEKIINQVVISYSEGKRSFMVIEDRSKLPEAPDGFKAVDINGAEGYIKTGQEDDSTEVYWFLNGVRYSVTGQISGNDALSIARSMK